MRWFCVTCLEVRPVEKAILPRNSLVFGLDRLAYLWHTVANFYEPNKTAIVPKRWGEFAMFPNKAARILSTSLLTLVFVAGCKTSGGRQAETPPPEFQANEITYVENDAFDGIFEASLVRQDPVIVVRTEFTKPEWGPRLNAWIAAWNKGSANNRTVRGQIPIPAVVVDGDSIREFRLLVNSLMNRVDDVARTGSNWFAEERTVSRRVALLQPYNLQFIMDEQGKIQLVFFHGKYAQYYPGFMRKLKHSDEEVESWSRTFDCAQCKRLVAARTQKSE